MSTTSTIACRSRSILSRSTPSNFSRHYQYISVDKFIRIINCHHRSPHAYYALEIENEHYDMNYNSAKKTMELNWKKKSLSLFQSLSEACNWLEYSKSLKTSVQRSRGRLDHMPSLPPHIPPQSTPQKHAEQRTERQRLVRFSCWHMCVMILYNIHRPHCVYCVYLCRRSQKSIEPT